MNTKPRLARRLTSAIGALALASASLFAAGIPATAAPAPTILGPGIVMPMANITNQVIPTSETKITGTQTPIWGWANNYDLAYVAQVPDSANAGDTWTVGLPSEIEAWPPGLTITNPSNSSEVWVNVSIANNVATFTLTPEGAAVSNLVVKANFGGSVINNANVGSGELQMTQGGKVIAVLPYVMSLPPNDPPDWTGKSIWFTDSGDQCRANTEGCIEGEMVIRAGDRGIVTITDEAQPNWTFDCDAVTLIVRDYNYNPARWTATPGRLTLTCSETSLKAVIDTSGATSKQSYQLLFTLDARVP